MKKSTLLLMAAGALALPLAVSAQVLVAHNLVGDMDRTNQDLPTESAWYKGGGSAITITESAEGLVWTTTGTSRFVTTNFTETSAGRTLVAGESLLLSYTFRPSAVVNNASVNTDNRFAVLSTVGGAARYTADNTSTANGPTVTGYQGYVINFLVSDTLADVSLAIRKINPASTSHMGQAAAYTDALSATTLVSGTGNGMTSGGLYSLDLSISFGGVVTASLVDVSTSSVLASIQATDDSPVGTFDAMMYRTSSLGGAGGAHTITDFNVTVVPEPSTYAAIMGLLGLGLVIYRRRARR